MILESLCNLAAKEKLLASSDYEPKPVAWIIALGERSRFLHLSSTATAAAENEKPRPKTMYIPRRNGRSGIKPVADFLVDNSSFVLGAEPSIAGRAPRPLEELARRLSLFTELVKRAADDTGSELLATIAVFLNSDTERARCITELQARGFAGNDLFTFEYQGHLAHDAPGVREWFSGARQEKGAPTSQCLVCGHIRPTVDKHPLVRVPGGTTSGVALVSFNSDAFESYGLERNANAPVCRECADAYTTALNRLLSPRYLDCDGIILGRRLVRLSSDTTAVFWADEESLTVELLSSLFDQADPDAVRAVLDAPWKGQQAAAISGRFFCLVVSGAQGRAVLRGLHTGAVEEAEANVREYFKSLEVEGAAVLPLYRLLGAAALQGKADNLSPGLPGEMFLAIVSGRALPRKLLSLAVQRCRAERAVTRERASLLRACLSFKHTDMEVKVSLDRENVRPGYRLGRLLSVLEQLQTSQRAKGTIVERFYGAASTRPATVFPGLIRLAQHHFPKSTRPVFYQRQLGEVLDGIPKFPATLNLEEQGLFALGYYQQRQEFFRSPATSGENEGDTETKKEQE
jgi:CRISPR-associated protein Csd1